MSIEMGMSRWWRRLVDPFCSEDSRWSSSNTTKTLTSDRVGDWLVSKLRDTSRDPKLEKAKAAYSRKLLDSLDDYENENRLLVKLADTGRVVQEITRGIETTLHILDSNTPEKNQEWREHLMKEREERVNLYEKLLDQDEQLALEIGDEAQQLEILTLMRHGFETFGEVWTPRELDLLSTMFDVIVRRTGAIANALPKWFTSIVPVNARKSAVDGGEEACLRQTTIWVQLHHPNVRKFYGACHVGSPFTIHELDQPALSSWSFFHDCALGLEYVHSRGFAHSGLSGGAFHYLKAEKRGILIGMGLLGVTIEDDNSDANDRTYVVNSIGERVHRLVSEDVATFGRVIFSALEHDREFDGTDWPNLDEVFRSPQSDYLSESERDLLRGLCAADPAERLSLRDAIFRIQELVKQQKLQQFQDQEIPEEITKEDLNIPVSDITTYVFPCSSMTIAAMLQEIGGLCEDKDMAEFVELNSSVYNRLFDLYRQFQKSYPDPVPRELVNSFATIVWDFKTKLDGKIDAPYFSDCVSRTIVDRNYGVHHDIDALVSSGSPILTSSGIHSWSRHAKQRRSRLENLGHIDELDGENSNEDDTNNVDRASASVSEEPTWFIPPHEVKRGKSLGHGSFGAVYSAKWLGANVVLKQVLTDQNKAIYKRQFNQEADLWFKLNHKHVIALYGANHVKRPFFICEFAVGGTLPEFLKRECGSGLWKCLQEAAMGLENLHDQGIIHGDLKGNNILVWMTHETEFESATTKVADFGLSTFAGCPFDFQNLGTLGAIRWKAPECLRGKPPTQASDIYSFGMCIIEAVTGDFPWGTRGDALVRNEVANNGSLPPRPEKLFTGIQWNLVERMCRFNPRERVNASAVVQLLDCIVKFDGEEDTITDDRDEEDTYPKMPPVEHTPVSSRAVRWQRGNHPGNIIKTEDRVGDYLVALYYEFIAAHRDCKRGLNIRGDLSTYEQETRVLVKLAATGSVITILLRIGRVLESYMEVLGITKSEQVQQWRHQLELERRERVKLFEELLLDEQCLMEAMGDECQKMEILTLLKRDVECYMDILTPQELDVMSDVYDQVVAHSGMVVGSVPSWFLSPSELLRSPAGCFLDDARVTECSTGGVLGNEASWEDEEEACLRQVSTWVDLNHPHVAILLGGRHVGKQPFLVHELAEPMFKNRASAHSWKPILGWALGLQYLHERELGYKSFENGKLLVQHSVTSNGVLSGLGLVPVQRKLKASLQRGVSDTFSMVGLRSALLSCDGEEANREQGMAPMWTVSDDVFAFGMAIYNTLKWVFMYGEDPETELPQKRPQFLKELEWDLVQKMCVKAPLQPVNMWYVVHQLQSFVTASELSPIDRKTPVDLSVGSGPANDLVEEESYKPPEKIEDFIVTEMHTKVPRAIINLEQIYKDILEASGMLTHVLGRLQDVHSQLQSTAGIHNPPTVMQGFVDLFNRYYVLLNRRHNEKQQPSNNTVASFCEARAAAQNITSFHHEIDRLLALAGLHVNPGSAHDAPVPLSLPSSRKNSSNYITTGDVHNWKLTWDKMRRDQLRDFQECLSNTSELNTMLSEPKAREEARMLLQFEAHKRRGSYPDSVLEAIANALKMLEDLDGGKAAEAVPNWFIPPYEVELGKFIAQGGFGEVYYGKWFDTDVVVKILKPQSSVSSKPSEENPVEDFRREADHWFMLSHQNVVHLYGACHVGSRRFFICEAAKEVSLNAHVENLARQNSKSSLAQEGRGDPSDIMRCLYLAGLGLKYLHKRGIIHSDLKQNNFMVGTDEKNTKLGDFGGSVVKRPGGGKITNYVALGASRWKAPEVLLGAGPSVESDVFSFGMCILELLSGEFPWGKDLPDAAVIFLVTKRRQLPPRPRGLSNIQWSLVQRMCCFDPSERISLDAAVDMLYTFRYEEPIMR